MPLWLRPHAPAAELCLAATERPPINSGPATRPIQASGCDGRERAGGQTAAASAGHNGSVIRAIGEQQESGRANSRAVAVGQHLAPLLSRLV